MKHYFRVSEAPVKQSRGFLISWLSGLSVVGWLILANIVFFVIALAIGGLGDECGKTLCNYLAIQPNNFFIHYYFWTLLTSMFMHGSLFHLFVNMFSLYFIGRFLEQLIGRKRFFWLYILSGIFAGLFFLIFSFIFGGNETAGRILGSPETYAVGASGALFAIAGVLALLTPRNKACLIAGPLIAIIIEQIVFRFVDSSPLKAIIDLLVGIYVFIAIFAIFNPSMRKFAVLIEMPFWMIPIAAIAPLFIISIFVELPIGNMAHLGGFIAGALYGVYLKIKYKKKTKLIAEYFS